MINKLTELSKYSEDLEIQKEPVYKCHDCGHEFNLPKGGRCPNCCWDRYYVDRFV